MAKLSAAQRAKVSDMAERMAAGSFKKNPKFKGDRKSQIFAITTARVKKRASPSR